MTDWRTIRVLTLVAVLAAALLLLAGYASAGPPTPLDAAGAFEDAGRGGDVLLSTFQGDDRYAAVAYNSDDQEFLAVWSHAGHIYGQRYDWQGVPQWENFAISTAPNGKYRPAVAYSPGTGSYLVVWEDFRSGSDFDIYGQRVGADGTLLDNTDPTVNFAIYTGVGDQSYVDVAFDGANHLVVWQGDQTGNPAVYGRLVADDGTVNPTDIAIASGGGVDRQEPAMAYNDTASEYLVVYQYDEGTNAEIRARRVDPAGTLPSAEYVIADRDDAQAPDVAAGNTGTYVVVWSDRRTGHSFIYGQVAQAGADALVGGDVEICTLVYNHYEPAIACSPSTGQFLVTWKDGRQDSETGWNIYGQRLLADGSLAGTHLAICDAAGDQARPAIAASQAPDIYFVAWEDERSGSDDIYGQRVAWTGSPLWVEFAVSAQPGWQPGAVGVDYDPDDDQYLIAWGDVESGAIHGQRLSAEGQLLEEPWVIEANGDHRTPSVAYNSQRGHYLVVWADVENDFVEGRIVYPAGQATVYFQVPGSDGGSHPSLAYDAIGDYFLVAWETTDGDVYARVLYGDGLAIGTLTTISTAADEQKDPHVAFDSDHERFLVTWCTDRPASGDDDILGRFVFTDGTAPVPEFVIAGGLDAERREFPWAAYNPAADEFVVVYRYVEAVNDTDIYGQRVSWNGTLAGAEFVVWSEVGAVVQEEPCVVYVPDLDRYYVAWSDKRNEPTQGRDLYGRWLAADGSPASASIPIFCYAGDQDWPRLAYDAGRQQALVTWTDYRRTSADVYARLGALDTTPPTARFLRDPTVGLAGTTFAFNAWPSTDDLTPRGALAVRWDWTSDGSWDTAWSFDKYVTQTVGAPGIYTVTLVVRDVMWYTDTISLPIVVLPVSANTPPTADLSVDPASGAAGSSFQFDASGSTDAETPGSLEVRWDWESDGVFDTGFGSTLTASHAYTVAGSYAVRAEVRDGGGLTDATTVDVVVTAGPVIALEVAPSAATVNPGERILFRATAWDAYGNEMANPVVTWSVTDGLAGTIDASGAFTASLAAGAYADVVQATSNGVNDWASVTIVWPYQVYMPLALRDYQ